MNYHTKQDVYKLDFAIKTKKNQHSVLETFTKKTLLRNLTRFYSGLFVLEILVSFTTAFLLKTII